MRYKARQLSSLNLVKNGDRMKKLIALILATVCVFGLTACDGRSGKDHDQPEDLHQFEAKILEIQDGYILVEPASETWESRSAGKIEVPTQNADPALKLDIGDSVLITYDGQVMETYPARLGQVYKIEKLTFVLTDGNP